MAQLSNRNVLVAIFMSTQLHEFREGEDHLFQRIRAHEVPVPLFYLATAHFAHAEIVLISFVGMYPLWPFEARYRQ